MITPIRVQKAQTTTGNSTTGTVTFGNGVGVGNLVYVHIAISSSANPTSSTSGLTKATEDVGSGSANITLALWGGVVGHGGPAQGTTAFTFTWAGAHSFVIYAEEWSAPYGWLPSALDVATHIDDAAVSTALDTGRTAITTRRASLLVAAHGYRSAPQTLSGITPGWINQANIANGANSSLAPYVQTVAAHTTAQVKATITTAVSWAGVVAAYQIATPPFATVTPSGFLFPVASVSGAIISGTASLIANSALAESARVVAPSAPVTANAALVETAALVISDSDPLVANATLADVPNLIIANAAPLVANSTITANAQVLSPSGDALVANAALTQNAARVIDPAVATQANTALTDTPNLIICTSAAMVANSALSASAQTVSPAGDALQANSTLANGVNVVIDPAIPVVSNSVLSVTGGVNGIVNGAASLVANSTLAITAQVVSAAGDALQANAVITQNARVVTPNAALQANTALVAPAQISAPVANALTLYETVTATTTLPNAVTLVANATGGAETGNNTALGTATGYGEYIWRGTGSAWAAAGALGSPSGSGALYDTTSLENTTISAGNWTPSVRGSLAGGNGNLSADFYIGIYIYHSLSATYTAIGTCVLTGQTITSTTTTYAFGATALPLATFGPGDKLYLDFWPHITANANTLTGAALRFDVANSATLGNATNALSTPGYNASANAALSASVNVVADALPLVANAAIGASAQLVDSATIQSSSALATNAQILALATLISNSALVIPFSPGVVALADSRTHAVTLADTLANAVTMTNSLVNAVTLADTLVNVATAKDASVGTVAIADAKE